MLEQIGLISNLETDTEKLIQIVLSGQPELAEVLKRNEMRQLSQRIVIRYHLLPMDFEDTVHYISHRMQVAGGTDGLIFSKGALKQIYRYSQGLPRVVNAVCDRALITAYSRDVRRISSRIAAAGIEDEEPYDSLFSKKTSYSDPGVRHAYGPHCGECLFYTARFHQFPYRSVQ